MIKRKAFEWNLTYFLLFCVYTLRYIFYLPGSDNGLPQIVTS